MNAGITQPILPQKTESKFDQDLKTSLQAFNRQLVQQFNDQTTTLASAITITPQSSIVHVTGTATIQNITVQKGVLGPLWLIADGAFGLTTGGNIAYAVTTTVGKAVELIYDGTTFYPVQGS